MPETEHANLRTIAEQLTGETLPGRSSNSYIELIERNIGTMVQRQAVGETGGTTYNVTSPNVDTILCDTTNGPVTVILEDSFFENGSLITVTDVANNAATNNITIETAGTQQIDGKDTIVIDVDGGAVDVEVNTSLLGRTTASITGTVGAIL